MIQPQRLKRVVFMLILLCFCLLPAQGDEELTRTIDRLVKAQDPPQRRVELGNELIEQLQQHPDADLELKVQLAVGLALIELERFPEAQDNLTVAIRLARETDNKGTLAHALWEQAVICFHLGSFQSAIDTATEGLDLARSIQRFDITWRQANILGMVLERTGDSEGSLGAFAQGLKAAEESKDDEGQAVILANLGVTQMNLGELDLALDLFTRARVIEEKSTGNQARPGTLANLGDLHILLDELDTAYEFHQEAFKLRQEQGLESEIARSQHSLGVIQLHQGKPEQALKYLENALEIRSRLGMRPEQVETLTAISVVYSVLDRGDEAADSASQCLGLAEQIQYKGRRLSILEVLAEVHEGQGDYAAANAILKEATQLEREQRNLQTRQRHTEFRETYETKEKEQQIAMLTTEKEIQELRLKRQEMGQNLLFFGALFLAVIAIAGWFAWAALRKSHKAMATANDRIQHAYGELEAAVRRIKRLEGMLPICSYCKSIRDETGVWHQLENYVCCHSEAEFTHSICPVCFDKHYPAEDNLSSQA